MHTDHFYCKSFQKGLFFEVCNGVSSTIPVLESMICPPLENLPVVRAVADGGGSGPWGRGCTRDELTSSSDFQNPSCSHISNVRAPLDHGIKDFLNFL